MMPNRLEQGLPDRRTVDPRLDLMAKQICDLQGEMAINTEVTKQVRDILTSFGVLSKVAKWCTAIGAFFLMVYTVYQKMTGR